MKSLYSQFDASLGDIFSPEGVYPLVKNCFVFEETEGTENFDPGETFPGLVVVPRIMNRKLHIGTLLGVICSQILAEFGVLVSLFFFFVMRIDINDSLDSNPRKSIRE